MRYIDRGELLTKKGKIQQFRVGVVELVASKNTGNSDLWRKV